jgi:hypothetical protein
MVSRRHASLSAVFSAMLLAGCGTAHSSTGAAVDDPANPARRGAWSVETRVNSIEYEGRRFSPAFAREGGDLTTMLEFFQQPRASLCAEPSLVEHDSTVEKPLIGFGGCSGSDVGPDGTLVLSCGTGDSQGTLRVSGLLDSESGEVQLTLAPPPGGSRDTDRMTFHLTQTLRRTGDCPLTP